MSSTRDLGRFAAIPILLAAYTLLAVVHTYPLVRHLDSHLPGLSIGDNVSFVWNIWWMRHALASSGAQFFDCPILLVPLGGPLVLHTHAALGSWIGATVLAPLSMPAAYNVLLLASLVLNGLAAYALAMTVTGRQYPSAVAGALFLLAPSITERLMGHFNLVLAWPLVLACVAFVRWWQRPTMPRAAVVALAVALTPYADYYYAVYTVLFAVVYVLVDSGGLIVSTERRRRSLWLPAAAASAVAFLIGLAIAIVDQQTITLAGVVISIRTPRNAFSAGWILAAVAVLLRWRFRVSAEWRQPSAIRSRLGQMALAAVVFALLVSPLLVQGWRLWSAGQYVTERSSLKSSPTGVDVATTVLGPPFNGLVGKRIRSIYARFDLDPMEGSMWIGVANLVFLGWAIASRRRDRDIRRWLAAAAVFWAWALGPYLMVLGVNSGLLLPQAAARFVPLLNNARMPSRAMVLVALSIAVSTAVLLSRHLTTSRARTAAAFLVTLAMLEAIAAPLPLVALPPAGVYEPVGADRGDGAVLPIPFGVSDGFGDTGLFEHDALYQQTNHGHPLVGGFLGRLPAGVRPWYGSHEPYATLLSLSAGHANAAAPSCESIANGLRDAHVRYVVVYRNDLTTELATFVSTRMPITSIAEDELRTLYEVDSTPCRQP